MSSRTWICLTTLGLMATTALPAQDERLMSSPVEHTWSTGVSYASLFNSTYTKGFRLVDIEVSSENPLRFAGTAVKNRGPYLNTSRVFHGVTSRDIQGILNASQLRMIDIDIMSTGLQPKFRVIFTGNQATYERTWAWRYGLTAKAVLLFASKNGMRVVDIEPYRSGSVDRYAVVFVKDPSFLQRKWSIKFSASETQLTAWLLQNRYRPYDIERRPDGRLDCIAVESKGERWLVRFNDTPQALDAVARGDGMRIIDLERRNSGRLDAILLQDHGRAALYGNGCPGSNAKRPLHSVYDASKTRQHYPVGTKLTFRLINAPAQTAAALMLGFSRAVWGSLLLPLPLDSLGAPGCKLYVAPALFVPVPVSAGTGTTTLPMPDDPRLVGYDFFTQFLVLDRPANTLGLTFGNGVRTLFGPKH